MNPHLPTAAPDNLFSFFEHTVSARERAHATLTNGSSTLSQVTSLSILETRRHNAADSRSRAEVRALSRKRPAGGALALDSQELSDEEEEMEKSKSQVNAFGYRFLIPIGRRMTQLEMEAAPSPTPSEVEHQQEDRGAPSPMASPPEEGVDLDASIEDRDDASTEYDSDDLQLMRDMDRSVGSATPSDDE